MENLILILQKTLIYAIPLLIVALGGVFAERSGVINLALEGEMIFGAFMGAIFVYLLQKNGIWLDKPQLTFICALAVGAASGAIYSLLLSFSAVKLKSDQTISGTALNMLAPAIVNTFGLVFFLQEKINMPYTFRGYAIINSNLPGLLRIFFDKAYLSTFVIIALFAGLSIWLYKSKIGTHLRACGEHPQAADSVGINVARMRYLGTTISGALAGLGGYAYIATVANGTAEATIGGMGFLALAIMIFGNWNPVGIIFGALMFGFLKCIGAVSSSIPFFANIGLPSYFYNIVPYVVVLVVLVIFRKKSGCPKAEGIPYEKGQR